MTHPYYSQEIKNLLYSVVGKQPGTHPYAYVHTSVTLMAARFTQYIGIDVMFSNYLSYLVPQPLGLDVNLKQYENFGVASNTYGKQNWITYSNEVRK